MLAVQKQKQYLKQKKPLDLQGHHALCEMNFHQMVSLLPGIKEGTLDWTFSAGCAQQGFQVKVTVIDDAPYTSTLEVQQRHHSLVTPRIVVRLYHDVGMAEIVSWDHHRHWLPEYPYPNPNMYHSDEKIALNQFLGEWLRFCLSQGLQESKTVIQFS